MSSPPPSLSFLSLSPGVFISARAFAYWSYFCSFFFSSFFLPSSFLCFSCTPVSHSFTPSCHFLPFSLSLSFSVLPPPPNPPSSQHMFFWVRIRDFLVHLLKERQSDRVQPRRRGKILACSRVQRDTSKTCLAQAGVTFFITTLSFGICAVVPLIYLCAVHASFAARVVGKYVLGAICLSWCRTKSIAHTSKKGSRKNSGKRCKLLLLYLTNSYWVWQ